MDEITEPLRPFTEPLRPVTDLLPPEGREFLEGGGWWLILAIIVLLVLLVIAKLLRFLKRGLFTRKRRPIDWDRDYRESLADCPLPIRPAGERRLTVYHVPVRLRLVVVAPQGTEVEVDALAVERLLDLIVPGLGALAQNDRPRIRVWPGQISHHGFAATFHRCTINPEGEGRPSRWVLVAGRAQIGKQPVLLGLGLWADEANALGRISLEPHQWLDVLRLRTAEA